MSLLDKATIITTPTAHSEGKLHSIKGGSVADFDVVRGSAATRVNAEGLIEDVATNIPRIDYTDGTASILLEPQSTNLQGPENWSRGRPGASGHLAPQGVVGDAQPRLQCGISPTGDLALAWFGFVLGSYTGSNAPNLVAAPSPPK